MQPYIYSKLGDEIINHCGKKIANHIKLVPCAQIGNTVVLSKKHGMQPYIFRIGGPNVKCKALTIGDKFAIRISLVPYPQIGNTMVVL